MFRYLKRLTMNPGFRVMARFGRIIFLSACLTFICLAYYRYTDIVKTTRHDPEEELRILRYFLSDWRSKVIETLNVSKLFYVCNAIPANVSMETWNNWNIMKLPKFEFLPNYKNPCWLEKHRPKITCEHVKSAGIADVPDDKRDVEVMRCLPYFFLIGQPKCGTTDIYARLKKHPDVELWKRKEYFWFERKRFDPKCSSINSYLNFHLGNSMAVQRSTLTGTDYHQKIIGDGSVDVMSDNEIWPLLPGNQGCQEPCVTNPDMIHHLNPEARIIASFRNPVERVFSDYIYEAKWLKYNLSLEDFHKEVVRKLALYTDCLKTRTLRACVYNGTLESAMTSRVRLLQGLYSVHLSDWLRVFPRSQIHVVHFESYTGDIQHHMASLFKFLDLRDLNSEEMKNVTLLATKNARKKGLEIGTMLSTTRQLLQEFYKPYNEHLVKILNDERFLWDT